VILKEDVATMAGAIFFSARRADPARTFAYVALMPAPTALTAASPSIKVTRPRNRLSRASRNRDSS